MRTVLGGEHLHDHVRRTLDPGLQDLVPLGRDVQDIWLCDRVVGEVYIHRRDDRFSTGCLGCVVQDAADVANHELVDPNRTRTQVEPAMDQFAAGFVWKCGVVGPTIGARSREARSAAAVRAASRTCIEVYEEADEGVQPAGSRDQGQDTRVTAGQLLGPQPYRRRFFFARWTDL